ncbi:hypothetical protein [Methylobrevis albus]|uniref:Uncharacterized protein n=1 Tax=Methylobrevis albus TaxID=2793297 RepID=A0A931MYX0_9HYPH|nr:hypothetical protein [Methylobrevis albus]MBH0237414.1 hypothetical protein [Methylobrevis albus]
MAITRREEARALDADERDLVERSHHPVLQTITDRDLADLVKLLRERRDKASTEANRRRREMRGKGAPKGAQPSADDKGSRLKVAVLAMAMRRINTETERRRRMNASATLASNARKALAMKQAADEAGQPDFNSRHAHKGMKVKANQRAENLVRPMELGRQRKAASVAQARRDSRPG